MESSIPAPPGLEVSGSAIYGMTHDHILRLLNSDSPKLRHGLWTEANSSALVVGLLISVVLFSELSPYWCILFVHLTVGIHICLQWACCSDECSHMLATQMWACLGLAVELYFFAMLAFSMRCKQERVKREQFQIGFAAGASSKRQALQSVQEKHAAASCPPAAHQDKRDLTAPRLVECLPRPTAEKLSHAYAPNARLAEAMAGKIADWPRIRRMARFISVKEYSLREFFDDCIASFPELRLFYHDETVAQTTTLSSGLSNDTEYQRTIGALFTVYWLMRLHIDGPACFCYGVDVNWRPYKTVRSGHGGRIAPPQPARLGKTSNDQFTESTLAFAQMNESQKRRSFLETMQWSMFDNLVKQAGCDPTSKGSEDRIMALLCLTAFHDIMKVKALLPVVQPEHAPFHGHAAGLTIHDHDLALVYILQYFPHLVPSFAGLPEQERKSVNFTQGKMNFNHGWFVQAEAPPGYMLGTLKSVLEQGATPQDLGLYFLHWFTDLAGAEATPLGGAEKFVLKFPHAVLASFLWSIPFLGKLVGSTETEVVEMYLKARWKMLAPRFSSPKDTDAVARMRLAIMAQSDMYVDTAFHALPHADRRTLVAELARTARFGQRFSTNADLQPGGPALLIYYGPALLQKNSDNARGLRAALKIFAEVLRVARSLWPLSSELEEEVVTITISELKMQVVEDVVKAKGHWVMLRHSEREGAVELRTPTYLQELRTSGNVLQVLDLSKSFDLTGTKDAGAKVEEEEEEEDQPDNHFSAERLNTAGTIGSGTALPFSNHCGLTAEAALAAMRQENWLLREEVSKLRGKAPQGGG